MLVKFTDTRGGTELGVRLDRQACAMGEGDFSAGTGTVHLVGKLTLDGVPVTCAVDISLETLSGQGCLRIVN